MFVYLAGDIMSSGSQYEMSQIEAILDKVGIEYYSPRKNKSINDKKAVSEEENMKLAEKILKADTDRLKKADTIIFNVKESSIGTLVELGQVLSLDFEAKKPRCFFLYDDIRRTTLREWGDRRSWSINQYLYGVVLKLSNGKGFISLEELERELKKMLDCGKTENV